jgi:hypothetical protein
MIINWEVNSYFGWNQLENQDLERRKEDIVIVGCHFRPDFHRAKLQRKSRLKRLDSP